MTRSHNAGGMEAGGRPPGKAIARALAGLDAADLGTAVVVWLCLALAAAVAARLWLGLSAEVVRVLVAGLLFATLGLCLGMGAARSLRR